MLEVSPEWWIRPRHEPNSSQKQIQQRTEMNRLAALSEPYSPVNPPERPVDAQFDQKPLESVDVCIHVITSDLVAA